MEDKRYGTSFEYAGEIDRRDPLSGYRDQFQIPPGKIYLLGNSLGLISSRSVDSVENVMEEWRRLGIMGWLEGDPPWFYLAEDAGSAAASLVGADPDEVICTGSTTYNIHSAVSTFYKPAGKRTRILAASDDFSSDIYALKSQIALRGLDWREELILVDPEENRLTAEEKLEEAMDQKVALALLPSVFYRSGQLLDIGRLVSAAHREGIIIGFDCSHSAGVVPHSLSRRGVDFALWCGYKYMCGGPGSPAFLYINSSHFGREPGLAGWFGSIKEKQFELSLDFEHARSAGGWQVSSPGIIGTAAMRGGLELILDAGIDRIREKSLDMTGYLIFLADRMLSEEPYSFEVVTPRQPGRRGGHVALARAEDAFRIKESLIERGVISDFRGPDIIRLAPSPLYNTYREIRETVSNIREIVDSGEYRDLSPEGKIIS